MRHTFNSALASGSYPSLIPLVRLLISVDSIDRSNTMIRDVLRARYRVVLPLFYRYFQIYTDLRTSTLQHNLDLVTVRELDERSVKFESWNRKSESVEPAEQFESSKRADKSENFFFLWSALKIQIASAPARSFDIPSSENGL